MRHWLHKLAYHSALGRVAHKLSDRLWAPYRRRRQRLYDQADTDYSIIHDKGLSVNETARKMVRMRCRARTDEMAAWILGAEPYAVAVVGSEICVEIDRDIASAIASGNVIELCEEDVVGE